MPQFGQCCRGVVEGGRAVGGPQPRRRLQKNRNGGAADASGEATASRASLVLPTPAAPSSTTPPTGAPAAIRPYADTMAANSPARPTSGEH